MESDCIALRGPRLEAAARDVNRRGQGRFRVGFQLRSRHLSGARAAGSGRPPGRGSTLGARTGGRYHRARLTPLRGTAMVPLVHAIRRMAARHAWSRTRATHLPSANRGLVRDALVIQRPDHRSGRVRFPPPPLEIRSVFVGIGGTGTERQRHGVPPVHAKLADLPGQQVPLERFSTPENDLPKRWEILRESDE
jgi:hypothetical protein